MHTYKKQERLSDIDTNEIGEHIEDFGDETLNKAFGKFCIMDDQIAFHKVLTDEVGFDDDEIDNGHYDIVQKTVEETLKQVNLVFKNFGYCLGVQRSRHGRVLFLHADRQRRHRRRHGCTHPQTG